MLRFVDLTEAYWTDGGAPVCAILETRTNRFLEAFGAHVLTDLEEVKQAAGERGVGLVPTNFFEVK